MKTEISEEYLAAVRRVKECAPKFTRPPWEHDASRQHDAREVIRHNGVIIAQVIRQMTMTQEEGDANARVLAALPNLYEALARLCAADNCNYTVETMRAEGMFEAGRDALESTTGHRKPTHRL